MSIYKKIHAIMVESEGIEKDMTVGSKENSYKAISESAVLNVIKPLLKKHGIVLFPVSVTISEDFKEFQGKYGATQRYLSTLHCKYKIVDIDTGESEILETVGYGTDSQDKASGKAMTYAYKVLLQKTFCLFSGEDTDSEHSDDITEKNDFPEGKAEDLKNENKQQQQLQTQTTSGVKMPTEAQLKRFYAIMNNSGKSQDEVKQYTATTFKKHSSKELTVTELNKLIDWLEGK